MILARVLVAFLAFAAIDSSHSAASYAQPQASASPSPATAAPTTRSPATAAPATPAPTTPAPTTAAPTSQHAPSVHIEPHLGCGSFDAIGFRFPETSPLALRLTGPFGSDAVPIANIEDGTFHMEVGPYDGTGMGTAIVVDAATGAELARTIFFLHCSSPQLSVLADGKPIQGPLCGEFVLRGTGFRPNTSHRVMMFGSVTGRIGEARIVPPPPAGDFEVVFATQGIPNQDVQITVDRGTIQEKATTITVMCAAAPAPTAPPAVAPVAASPQAQLPTTSTLAARTGTSVLGIVLATLVCLTAAFVLRRSSVAPR